MKKNYFKIILMNFQSFSSYNEKDFLKVAKILREIKKNKKSYFSRKWW